MSRTSDRTTLKAALAELAAKLTANLVADPPTGAKPLRGLTVGAGSVMACPRPFMALRLARTRTIAVMDDDKVLAATVLLTLVTDVSASDPHDALLDKIGAVEDYLDSLIDIGVMEGTEGSDDREWTFEYPSATTGARVVSAQAVQTLIVKVERGQNREPAVLRGC